MPEHRLAPPPPARRAPQQVPPAPHAPLFLAAADHLDLTQPSLPEGPLLLGFAFVDRGVDVHITTLPSDDRCAAGGLFEFRAPDHWCGVGVMCRGTAHPSHRDFPSAPDTSVDAAATLIVDRQGTTASSIRLDGAEPHDPGAPGGLLIDALHRTLDLPTPGPTPPAEALIHGLWLDELIEHAVEQSPPSWAEAALLHPGRPSEGATVAPSVETVAESTLRVLNGRTWTSLRADAVRGTFPAPDLTPAEATWMDDTLFARWVLSALPDSEVTVAVLRVVGAADTADRVLEVCELLGLDSQMAPE